MTERYSHFDPEYLHSKLDELMRFQPAKPTTDHLYPTRRRVARSLTPTRRDRRRFRYLRGSGIPGSNRRHSAWEAKRVRRRRVVPRCKPARRLQIGGTRLCTGSLKLHRIARGFLLGFYPVPATTRCGSRSCGAAAMG
jgi:hypothetical protein